MTLDRADYWNIANALAKLPNTAEKYEVILKMCDLLRRDNPKSDAEVFIDASEAINGSDIEIREG